MNQSIFLPSLSSKSYYESCERTEQETQVGLEEVVGWLRVLVSQAIMDHDASLSDALKQMAGIHMSKELRQARRKICESDRL